MKLSIVIVNYNVRYFLEQALGSVRRALGRISGEIWVVDNNSVDDSLRMVSEKFPEAKVIANKNNPGFAIANNMAIRQSTGEYVLLLNPDTLVEEDTFEKCIEFMDAHPDAGALGVKMIDGSGKFLPESKRGFPTPWVAFCKACGLSTLFPKSKRFNQYHLGYLSENETHVVDVLSGAFMFMRRSALDKSGLLDEAFFMYGEDIDLSYRIVQAGYKNYYLASTSIIHYKGESTKKGSLNYVRHFYQAMIIFARKHFTGSKAGLFVAMLKGAIWMRAGITLVRSFAQRMWLPALDAALIYGGLLFLKDFWANYYYKDPTYFKPTLLWFNFPLYTLIWILSVWVNGGYDGKYDLRRIGRGLALGTLFLAAVYGFLDLDYRPSRALLLLGAAWALVALAVLRLALHFAEYKNLRIGRGKVRNLVIAGDTSESDRVHALLNQAGVSKNFIGTVAPEAHTPDRAYLGTLDQLDEIVQIYKIEEIIFCSKNIPSRDILAWMTRLGPAISYKIVPEESLSIIGSSNKNEPGELYTIDIRYNIAQPGQRRNKRALDLLLCGLLLVTAPIWLLFSPKRKRFSANWLSVLFGKITWVGYAPAESGSSTLPTLKPGVFSPLQGIEKLADNAETVRRLNYFYAKDWNVWRDLELMSR